MPTKRNLSRLFKCHRGTAMTELLVSLPALLLMGLGSLQTALLFDAKTVINSATFEAARKGAVNHAQSDAMRQELGLRLAPLFGGDGSARKAISAITRARLDVQDSRFTEIEIINPTIEAFEEFGREIVDPRTDEVHFGIPNSHLRWRSNHVGNSGVNIQDANLLKIKVTYGYQLKVPLMDRVIPAVMRMIDPEHIQYYNARRLPITSVATVRMQSDAWRDENNVHMDTPGSGGTPPTTENEPRTGASTPDEETGQGGDEEEAEDTVDKNETDDADPPSSGANPYEGIDENGDGDDLLPISDDDDLPSISEGDDHGPAVCGNTASAEDETFSPTSQTSGIASSHIGNPIHVVTGNKYQQEVDLTPLPG
ncbi:MAG: TadE/TadG family type IV pilus assembly protein, partial [Candidatus Thiodiazotropha sp.]